MDNLHLSKGYRIPPIKELCDILEHKFNEQEAENERLLKENESLKNGLYKDEKYKEMAFKYKSMKEDYYRGFPISKEEQEKN